MSGNIATPDAVTLAGFLACGFFVVSLVNQVMRLMDRNKEQPRPIDTYATKAELEVVRIDLKRVESSIIDLRHEMREDRETILKAGEERAVKIHDRINDVLAAVSEVKGEIKK